MAHIPQDQSYVNPPSEWEADEDRVTEVALDLMDRYGKCPTCQWGPEVSDKVWEEDRAGHAEFCFSLRQRAIRTIYAD